MLFYATIFFKAKCLQRHTKTIFTNSHWTQMRQEVSDFFLTGLFNLMLFAFFFLLRFIAFFCCVFLLRFLLRFFFVAFFCCIFAVYCLVCLFIQYMFHLYRWSTFYETEKSLGLAILRLDTTKADPNWQTK